MSREIKFKVWDDDLKEMCEVYGLDKIYVKYVSKPHTDEDAMYESPLSSVSLLQYTGLKDKNGVEIYEGDIVKTLSKDIQEIKFFNGIFWCGDGNAYLYVVHSSCEVIGNIYEHGELLKDSQ